MTLEINSIVSGKVTGIKDFGAFVALPDGQSGLVHISEIAHGYVENARQHLTEGQEVQVKILPPDKSGRMNLSIKKAVPQEPRQETKRTPMREPQSFEDKLKSFMQTAETNDSPRADRRKKGKDREQDEYDDFDDEF